MVKIWNCPYKDGLMEMLVYYQTIPDIENAILTMQSVRSVIEAGYQVLVNKKEMEPIENLPAEEKWRIWIKTFDLKTKDERIKASRAIYLMEKILNHG